MTWFVGLAAFTFGFICGSYAGWQLFWFVSMAEYRRRVGGR